jgi:hypothetical protein
MKKIGILTFHRALNYGALLQAYSLQRVLVDNGYDAELVDYRCKFIESYYVPLWKKIFISPKRFLAGIIFNGDILRRRDEFEEFTRTDITVSSNKYENLMDLSLIQDQYDYFITGSDQVWSPVCAGFDKAYFLDFVVEKSKKKSYAASFGVSLIPEEMKTEYRKLLKNFDRITVREEEGQRLVEQIIGIEPPLVVDPTLLLNKLEWLELCGDTLLSEKDFILVYLITEDSEVLSFAKKLSEKTGKKIIYINDRIIKRFGMDNKSNVSVKEWISYFMKADYVVTNSFHGVAFSVNFNKEFYVRYIPGAKVNSRISGILSRLNLEARIIPDSMDISTKKINYTNIEKDISVMRNDSKDVLFSML